MARREVRQVLELFSQRPDGMREQMSLQLKTKTFDGRASSAFEAFTDDMVDKDGNVRKQQDLGSVDECPDHQTDCSICMMEIEHGERIGDLDCGHQCKFRIRFYFMLIHNYGGSKFLILETL